MMMLNALSAVMCVQKSVDGMNFYSTMYVRMLLHVPDQGHSIQRDGKLRVVRLRAYRLAYADFRSGAWTVAPCGGE